MMNDRERRTEIGRLYDRMRANAHGPGDIARFRELVRQEIQPVIDGEMPRILAERRRREAAREAARRAGQQAGVAAGRRFMERLQREREREAADAWRRIVERRGR